MSFLISRIELNRFFEREADAAGISVEEYQETLLALWRHDQAHQPQFASREAMVNWFETDEGQSNLLLLVYSINRAGARRRAATEGTRRQNVPKEDVTAWRQETNIVLFRMVGIPPQQSRKWQAEMDLITSKAFSIARQRDTEVFDAEARRTAREFSAIIVPGEPDKERALRLRFLQEHDRVSMTEVLTALGFLPMPSARLAELEEEAVRTRPTVPPAWLAEIQPENPSADGTNGLYRLVEAWPGDESDEEVREALERIS